MLKQKWSSESITQKRAVKCKNVKCFSRQVFTVILLRCPASRQEGLPICAAMPIGTHTTNNSHWMIMSMCINKKVILARVTCIATPSGRFRCKYSRSTSAVQPVNRGSYKTHAHKQGFQRALNHHTQLTEQLTNNVFEYVRISYAIWCFLKMKGEELRERRSNSGRFLDSLSTQTNTVDTGKSNKQYRLPTSATPNSSGRKQSWQTFRSFPARPRHAPSRPVGSVGRECQPEAVLRPKHRYTASFNWTSQS